MVSETTRETLDEDWDDWDESQADNKYLSFVVHGEHYGVSVGYVSQIIGMRTITTMPEMPPFLKGVVNFRGKVIPVVDIRVRFGLPERDYDDRTCIIVVTVEETPVGLVIDRVGVMVDIPPEQVEAAPKASREYNSRFLQGLGKVDEEVYILLDVEQLLYDEELEQLSGVAAADEGRGS